MYGFINFISFVSTPYSVRRFNVIYVVQCIYYMDLQYISQNLISIDISYDLKFRKN